MNISAEQLKKLIMKYDYDNGCYPESAEEERATLWKKMSHIFDSDIAPYVDLKCFGKVPIIKEPTVELM